MINEIIKKNCIQQIGILYSDLIISREEFVSTIKDLNNMGYYIVEISWWLHIKIDEENHISLGGPKDNLNNEYYWGETNFSRSFSSKELIINLREVLEYYDEFCSNDNYNLFPAITLDIAYKK
jgi:hypothetical protein